MPKVCALLLPLLLSLTLPSNQGILPKTGDVLWKVKIVRGAPGDQFGRSIDVIGDLDNDGVPDLVVGATHDDDGNLNSGSIWILFMNADQTVKSSTKISQSQNGLTGASLGEHNWLGKDVVGLGDLDGDGVEDIAAGAPSRDTSSDRRVFILFMNTDGTVKSWTSIFRSTNGFGRALANMGDMDGDGVTDLMVGTAFGHAYLYYLNSNGSVKSFQTYNERTQSTPGFDSFYALSMDMVGDLDGDGITDAIIGDTAADYGGVTDSGTMYVSLVSANGFDKQEIPIYDGQPNMNLSLPTYPNFGRDGALLNDLDGNGTLDLAIGCSEWFGTGDPQDSGAVFITFLDSNFAPVGHKRISRTCGNLNQNLPNFVEFGISLCPLGDLNGDGTTDIGVGARFDGSGSIFILMLNDGTLTFPDASATATPTSGSAPLGVQFTDTSTGSVTGWSWDFGDGNTSTQQHPLHTYTTQGTFDVTLTVTGPGEMVDSRTYNNLVDVQGSSGPVANFSTSRTRGLLPLEVHFNDLSVGSPTSWAWNFGDGATSNQENPTHVYDTRGTYTVSLTATSAAGSDQITRENLILAGFLADAGAGAEALGSEPPAPGPQHEGPWLEPTERHELERTVVGNARGSLLEGQGAIETYGCGKNPSGSLAVHGRPAIGESLLFELDQPQGSAGANAVLFLATAPDPAFPCGTLRAPGESLIDWRTPAHRLRRMQAPAWSGPGTPTALRLQIPHDPALVGLELFAQGVFTGPEGARRAIYTEAVRILVGP